MPKTQSRSHTPAQKRSGTATHKPANTEKKRATSTNNITGKIDAASTLSKSDRILKLLSRRGGASLAELKEATGWQAHSLRGFLSGTVKKRLGLNLQVTRSEAGERRYLLTESQ